jgi:hypothetical protein
MTTQEKHLGEYRLPTEWCYRYNISNSESLGDG